MICGCEDGYACTIISVCAVESMVYDAVEELETALSESMKLERKLNGGIAKLQSRNEELEAKLEAEKRISGNLRIDVREGAKIIGEQQDIIDAVRKMADELHNRGYSSNADSLLAKDIAEEFREKLGGSDE